MGKEERGLMQIHHIASLGREMRTITFGDRHDAMRHRYQPGNCSQKSSLADTGRAYDDKSLGVHHVERDILQPRLIAEAH